MLISFELGTSTHVCSWSITDHYIIKRHVSHAWYWFWTIKALVEAEVLLWLYSDLQGHSSSVEHCHTSSVFLIILAKNLFLRQKYFADTGCACTSSVASKRAVIKWLAKNLFQKNAYPLVMYASALQLLHNIAFHLFWGDQASMHPHEADWTQTGGCYDKARLNEVLHAPLCINIGQHRWSCVMMCSTQLWETHCSVTINP